MKPRPKTPQVYHAPQVTDYHAPQVTDYGNIKEITMKVAHNSPNFDSGNYPNSRTH